LHPFNLSFKQDKSVQLVNVDSICERLKVPKSFFPMNTTSLDKPLIN